MKLLPLMLILPLAACGGYPEVPEGAPTVTVAAPYDRTDIDAKVLANMEASRLCGHGMIAVPQGTEDGVTTYACAVR